ncbi:hypothetical protein FJT64_025776 [Amphibalanus amphitrite]|uniref:Uncharacterized protein n=1 Tax=Amphibalanus amphitrite TaxID=1232801 RepID=A0A6A4WE71_AMPAM|nr:hypothetical protein FJT64_025776 [Amphibalanus amphitrite]
MACCDPSPPPGEARRPGSPLEHHRSSGEPYEHPAAGCPGPPDVPCPHVPDTRAATEAPVPCTSTLQTAQQMGLRSRPAHQLATDGVLVRTKYETLPDHLQDLAVSQILSSDRFLSTAAESYTFKRRDRCLNPEPVYSPAPPSGSVEYLGEVEQRLRNCSLPASKPRFSEYSEAFAPRRHLSAPLTAVPYRPCALRPATDVLPRHVFTATSGVAGEVNPYLSTTSKDFQPVSAAAARRYRDAPSEDTFTGDPIVPEEAVPQPHWHHFTPTVPNTGLTTEIQQRYRPPRLDWCSRHNWTTEQKAPLVVPPTTRQLMGEAQFERESDNYGTGRHNSVVLSCGGLVGRQKHRRHLCNLKLEDPVEQAALNGR